MFSKEQAEVLTSAVVGFAASGGLQATTTMEEYCRESWQAEFRTAMPDEAISIVNYAENKLAEMRRQPCEVGGFSSQS